MRLMATWLWIAFLLVGCTQAPGGECRDTRPVCPDDQFCIPNDLSNPVSGGVCVSSGASVGPSALAGKSAVSSLSRTRPSATSEVGSLSATPALASTIRTRAAWVSCAAATVAFLSASLIRHTRRIVRARTAGSATSNKTLATATKCATPRRPFLAPSPGSHVFATTIRPRASWGCASTRLPHNRART
jgi:hypothetical protein